MEEPLTLPIMVISELFNLCLKLQKSTKFGCFPAEIGWTNNC